MISQRILFVFLLILSGLVGCGKDASSFYPLAEGITWEYQFSWDYNWTDDISKKSIATNLASRDLQGTKVVPQKAIIDEAIYFEFIAEDDSGIFVFAEQSKEDFDPKLKSYRDYFVKYPIKVGASWQVNASNVYVHSSGEKVPAVIKYTIESLNDVVVTVAAGNFTNCLKVKSESIFRTYIKNWGEANVSRQTYVWYAPEIGGVKYKVTEHTDKYIPRINATLFMEFSSQLVSFKSK